MKVCYFGYYLILIFIVIVIDWAGKVYLSLNKYNIINEWIRIMS